MEHTVGFADDSERLNTYAEPLLASMRRERCSLATWLFRQRNALAVAVDENRIGRRAL